MVEVSCKEKIMGSMHLLTNSESKIAKYVLDNFNETLNYNVSELADKAGVSDASVVRFCKSLGYKGILKSALRRIFCRGTAILIRAWNRMTM